MYEAIIIFVTGDKETHKYATEKEAYKACDNYVKAFGYQVDYTYVRRCSNV